MISFLYCVCTYIDAIFSKIFPIFEIFYHFFYSLTLRTHSARVRCAVFIVTSWHVPRSDQEGRQAVPSWISLSVPRYNADNEIDILFACAVLQGSQHARRAENAVTCKYNSYIVERSG